MYRAPTACEAIDMAGIGEKPATRSGPWAAMVWTWAAAAISRASSHPMRTRPPLPRADWYRRRLAGSPVISAQAATGFPRRLRASR